MLGPHTVTVVRAGSKPSDYGTGVVPDWDAATRVDYTGCSVQFLSGEEYTADRDVTIDRWQVWVDVTTDVVSTDRIEWAGASYEIDGEVQRWEFPPLAHKVVPMLRSVDA
jgi:hypothetical protein